MLNFWETAGIFSSWRTSKESLDLRFVRDVIIQLRDSVSTQRNKVVTKCGMGSENNGKRVCSAFFFFAFALSLTRNYIGPCDILRYLKM